MQKVASRPAARGVTAPAAAWSASKHEDCGRVAWGWVVMPVSDSCPNGAECDNPGQRPGIHATHIAAFSRTAADRRITHLRPHPRPNDAVPERCGAPSERIRTRHPCPGCMPAVPSSGLHPGLVCGAPSERIHTHRPCPGCMPAVRVPRVAPWADMRRSFRAHACPPSVSRTHSHRPCPGCMPAVRVPRVAPWADMRCPLVSKGTRRLPRATP